MCNEKEDPEKWLTVRKMPMRDISRRLKVKALLEESDYLPVKLGNVEY